MITFSSDSYSNEVATMAKDAPQWSPLRELENFRRDFDQVFDRFFGKGLSSSFSSAAMPKIESYVEGDKMIVRADLPGADPKDVEVTVTGETLTLRGTRETREEKKGRDFIHREVSSGSFERSLPLPKGVRIEDIKASYQHGVLELTIPIPQNMTPRKVPIEVAAGEPSAEKK
jgi:HSP20 family protein